MPLKNSATTGEAGEGGSLRFPLILLLFFIPHSTSHPTQARSPEQAPTLGRSCHTIYPLPTHPLTPDEALEIQCSGTPWTGFVLEKTLHHTISEYPVALARAGTGLG